MAKDFTGGGILTVQARLPEVYCFLMSTKNATINVNHPNLEQTIYHINAYIMWLWLTRIPF